MQIVLLGSGGWIPTPERETCCALVRSEGHGVLIDAGTGVRRLIEQPALLAGLETRSQAPRWAATFKRTAHAAPDAAQASGARRATSLD